MRDPVLTDRRFSATFFTRNNQARQAVKFISERFNGRTSIMLLLLIVITRLPFALYHRPALYLRRILCFVLTSLGALKNVRPLGIKIQIRPNSIRITGQIIALKRDVKRAKVMFKGQATRRRKRQIPPKDEPRLSTLGGIISDAVRLIGLEKGNEGFITLESETQSQAQQKGELLPECLTHDKHLPALEFMMERVRQRRSRQGKNNRGQ